MWNTPSFRLFIVLVFGLFGTITAVNVATQLPRTQTSFGEGETIRSPSGSITLESLDLIPEPSEISNDAAIDRFYERQDQITNILSQNPITVLKKDQELSISLQNTGASDLQPLFWIQLAVGLGALIISGWVWALKPQDLASQLFFLSGISTLTFTFPSAVYTTRELAMHSSLFLALTGLNAVGASLFGIVMIALFLIYPTRIKHGRFLIFTQALFFGTWTVLSILRILSATLSVNLVTFLEMIGICIAIGAQFFMTKHNPQARASLTWLGLAVFFGAGSFIFLNATPLVLGVNAAVSQGYAFLFFLVIYVGIAAGLKRYRLFEVG